MGGRTLEGSRLCTRLHETSLLLASVSPVGQTGLGRYLEGSFQLKHPLTHCLLQGIWSSREKQRRTQRFRDL